MDTAPWVPPSEMQWLKSVTFGDVMKITTTISLAIVMFVKLQDRVDRESELRAMLEVRTIELISTMRTTQVADDIRIDRRLTETAQRDRETIVEVKAGLARLSDKLDTVSQVITQKGTK